MKIRSTPIPRAPRCGVSAPHGTGKEAGALVYPRPQGESPPVPNRVELEHSVFDGPTFRLSFSDGTVLSGRLADLDVSPADLSPKVQTPAPQRDVNRCAVCGGSLRPTFGCRRGNCAMRPVPTTFYDQPRARRERAYARALGVELGTFPEDPTVYHHAGSLYVLPPGVSPPVRPTPEGLFRLADRVLSPTGRTLKDRGAS